MSETMVAEPAPERAPERLNLAYHGIIGLAIGLITPFTALAWPIAILTGMVIGRANIERARGIRVSGATSVIRVLAVTGGVLGMMVFGAIIGGLIAFTIVALAAFSEQVAGGASSNDQTIVRILIFVVAILTWIVLVLVLNLNVSFKFGS
jgi:hypothetical protein